MLSEYNLKLKGVFPLTKWWLTGELQGRGCLDGSERQES